MRVPAPPQNSIAHSQTYSTLPYSSPPQKVTSSALSLISSQSLSVESCLNVDSIMSNSRNDNASNVSQSASNAIEDKAKITGVAASEEEKLTDSPNVTGMLPLSYFLSSIAIFE